MNITKLQNNRLYNILVRLVIILATYTFVFKKFVGDEFDWNEPILSLKSRLIEFKMIVVNWIENDNFYFIIFFVIFLMFVNWGIEALKWKYLIDRLERISFLKSYKAVFSGVSVSIFTPNRIGEWFGRIFILEKANPWESMFATIIGSISQLFITLIVGTISFVIFIALYATQIGEKLESNRIGEIIGSEYFIFVMMLIGAVAVFILIAVFINVRILPSIIKQFIKKKFIKFYEYFSVIKQYSSRELANVLLISLGRYLVFSLQFYLVLKILSVNIPIYYGLLFISVFYFIMTAIPTVTLAEIGMRGSVSVFIFGLYFYENGVGNLELEAGIFAASSVVWFINLVIPAIIGTFFVNKLRFFRKYNNSNNNSTK